MVGGRFIVVAEPIPALGRLGLCTLTPVLVAAIGLLPSQRRKPHRSWQKAIAMGRDGGDSDAAAAPAWLGMVGNRRSSTLGAVSYRQLG